MLVFLYKPLKIWIIKLNLFGIYGVSNLRFLFKQFNTKKLLFLKNKISINSKTIQKHLNMASMIISSENLMSNKIKKMNLYHIICHAILKSYYFGNINDNHFPIPYRRKIIVGILHYLLVLRRKWSLFMY